MRNKPSFSPHPVNLPPPCNAIVGEARPPGFVGSPGFVGFLRSTNRHGDTKDFSGKGAFTLVELLVVLAIIGILAAVLIPAINSVKKRALVVESVSRLRSIGLATLTYANENNADMPIDGGDPTTSWAHTIKRYLDSKWADDSQELYTVKVYRDATQDYLIEEGGTALGTWGYNQYFNQGTGKSTSGPWQYTTIVDPANTPLFASLNGEQAGLELAVTGPNELAERYGYTGPTHQNGASPNHDGTTLDLMADWRVFPTTDPWPWKDNLGTSFHPLQDNTGAE